MPRPELDLTAHCDCGAVTLQLKGKAVSMFQCGCENCQKVSGSGHSSAVLMPASSTALSGVTKSFERPADSGATFTRHFCPDCGTTMLAHSSRAPDLRIVPTGLLAGHNDWFSPNQLIFARSHPGWDLIAEQIPRHETYRPEKS